MKSLFRRLARPGALARFRDDESGNVIIIFALAIVVLMLSIGAAVDIGRWLHARDQTMAAIDAAVLAGGRTLQLQGGDQTAALDAAKRFYTENVKSRLPVIEGSDTVSFSIADDGKGISASGNAYIKTPFLRLASVDKLPLISGAGANFAQSKIAVGGNGGQSIEVSLILDITGSMRGSKLDDLKAAAKNLVNTVIWEDQSEFYSKVALVPYSIGVNVGNYATKVRGATTGGTCTTPGCTKYKFTNASSKQRTFPVSTCATERTGTNAYTDVSATTAKVGLNYHADPTVTDNPNPCPTAQLVPLTSNKDTLTAAIDSYAAAGSTAGHIGLAWGWYTLSPNWANVFTGDSAPASYTKLTELGPKGQPVLKKIAVLMTDGDFNTAYCKGVISKDSTWGSGSSDDHINCNATNGSSASQALSMCTAMKKAGITLYTVGFDVGDQSVAQDLMNKCATDPSKVYIASSGEELINAFQDIALKLSSLYLSK